MVRGLSGGFLLGNRRKGFKGSACSTWKELAVLAWTYGRQGGDLTVGVV